MQIFQKKPQKTDPLLPKAIGVALEHDEITPDMLSGELRIGYARARELFGNMVQRRLIAQPRSERPAKVLVTYAQFCTMYPDSAKYMDSTFRSQVPSGFIAVLAVSTGFGIASVRLIVNTLGYTRERANDLIAEMHDRGFVNEKNRPIVTGGDILKMFPECTRDIAPAHVPQTENPRPHAEKPRQEDVMNAALIAVEQDEVSATMLQRRLRIGFARACAIMDELSERGVIAKSTDYRSRETIMDAEETERMFGITHV